MIKRWDIDGRAVESQGEGDYVLYSDHMAEIERTVRAAAVSFNPADGSMVFLETESIHIPPKPATLVGSEMASPVATLTVVINEMVLDKPNANKRIYPRDLVKAQLDIGIGRMPLTLGQREDGATDLSKVGGVLSAYELYQDGQVGAVFKLIDTDASKQIMRMVNLGNASFCSVGVGRVEITSDYYIVKDYQMNSISCCIKGGSHVGTV
jgi:hypothetical protein